MKALTIRQPWAELVASGRKTIEVRTWTTAHRGPLLIHASKSPRLKPIDLHDLSLDPDLVRYGHAIAVAHLADVRPLTPADYPAACFTPKTGATGLYAWVLEDTRRLAVPAPYAGRLGLWDTDTPPPGRRGRTPGPCLKCGEVKSGKRERSWQGQRGMMCLDCRRSYLPSRTGVA